jgi:hypothetical protein
MCSPADKWYISTVVLDWLNVINYWQHERTTTAKKHGNTQISPNLTHHKLWKMLAPGMPGRYSYQTKPGLPSGCQVNIKCFNAKSTCLCSNYRNISSRTLVQNIIPGYLQRPVDTNSWAYMWLISHDRAHGVPLMDWMLLIKVVFIWR